MLSHKKAMVIKMLFTKAHGLGNDFVIIDDRNGSIRSDTRSPADLARRICDRHTGVGADGLILVCEPENAAHDSLMRIWNSDGSEAEMCGNGIRCFAKYLYDYAIVPKTHLTIETLAGLMEIDLTVGANAMVAAKVDMGVPEYENDGKFEKIVAGDREFSIASCLLGVPHTVVLTDALSEKEILKYGPIIEKLPRFPHGSNANFAHRIDSTHVEVCTFERGAGMTLACGTGSSSTAAILCHAGMVGKEVEISLMLGTLTVTIADNGHVYMEGPAEVTFVGDFIG